MATIINSPGNGRGPEDSGTGVGVVVGIIVAVFLVVFFAYFWPMMRPGTTPGTPNTGGDNNRNGTSSNTTNYNIEFPGINVSGDNATTTR